MFTKNSTIKLKDLDLNMEPFKKMGGRYIFSSLPIEHPEKNHLILDQVFHSHESVWRIYLYKVK
jgi:hypothetical protein